MANHRHTQQRASEGQLTGFAKIKFPISRSRLYGPPADDKMDVHMAISFSLAQVHILLGGRLMYWGVPFHMTSKQTLQTNERSAVDAVRERLLELRDQLPNCQQQDPSIEVTVDMSIEECKLYKQLLAADLAECVGPGGDRELEIHVGRRPEVEACLAKLHWAISSMESTT